MLLGIIKQVADIDSCQREGLAVKLWICAVALAAIGIPGERACGGFMWLQPNWQTNSTIGTPVPPVSDATATIGPTSGNSFSTNQTVFVQNPPQPGGPMISVSTSFSRMFRIVEDVPGVPVMVPFTLTLLGSMTHGGIPGTSATYTFMSGYSGSGSPIFNTGSNAPSVVNFQQSNTIPILAGIYTYSGFFGFNASATAGGPTATGNITTTVGIDPTGIEDASAVPAPPAILLLLAGVPCLALMKANSSRDVLQRP